MIAHLYPTACFSHEEKKTMSNCQSCVLLGGQLNDEVCYLIADLNDNAAM